MRYVLALSHSAFVIRHWFEINLDDASMEHGARIELRELPVQPHRGTESAAQLVTLDRPLWRADLFDRLADAEDAAEIRGLAGTVVATARQFEASRCASAADCHQLTRDVGDTVRLMIDTLQNPGLLDTGWVSPWMTSAS
jgi:hypothetical protein